MDETSYADVVRKMSPVERAAWLDGLTEAQTVSLPHQWWFWSRKKQQEPPGDWTTWVIMAGRGFGKTRSGAEFVRDSVVNKGYKHAALVGKNASDVREIMIEGPSGLLNISPRHERPLYEISRKRLVWPNGAIGHVYYGSEPDSLRGPEHDIAWCDELAAWQYPDETMDNLMMGMRVGIRPKVCITTTPKPIKQIKNLVKMGNSVCITRGSTYENEANLSSVFISNIKSVYEGTRLGRQEIYAEVLDDNPNALWKRAWIDAARVNKAPDMERIIVAIDPEASSDEESAETGIIVAGRSSDKHFYVFDDLTIRETPAKWGAQAVTAYNKYRCDRIIGERNNGGDMVASTIRNVDPNVPFSSVWASRGKVARAEPVSALYEHGKVHHVGTFASLEDQLCEWVPGGKSPDRLDALVWAISELMIGHVFQAIDADGNVIY